MLKLFPRCLPSVNCSGSADCLGLSHSLLVRWWNMKRWWGPDLGKCSWRGDQTKCSPGWVRWDRPVNIQVRSMMSEKINNNFQGMREE